MCGADGGGIHKDVQATRITIAGECHSNDASTGMVCLPSGKDLTITKCPRINNILDTPACKHYCRKRWKPVEMARDSEKVATHTLVNPTSSTRM